MTVEWLRSTRGKRTSHAKIDGVWACSFAGRITAFDPAPRSSIGHVLGDVCAHCAVEVNASAVLAREEARREARGE